MEAAGKKAKERGNKLYAETFAQLKVKCRKPQKKGRNYIS